MPKRKFDKNSKKKSNNGPKRTKYFNPSNHYLMPGDVGFLLSYNVGLEREMTHNVFKILNQFDDSIIADQAESTKKNDEDDDEDEEENQNFDIITALQTSITEDKQATKRETKTWNKIDPQVKSISFFKTKNSDKPLEILKICDKIFNFSKKTNFDKNLATKGFSRILPVLATCKISDGNIEGMDKVSDSIKDLVKMPVFDLKYVRKELGGTYDQADQVDFPDKKLKLKVEIKCRNNTKVDKSQLLKTIMGSLSLFCPGNRT